MSILYVATTSPQSKPRRYPVDPGCQPSLRHKRCHTRILTPYCMKHTAELSWRSRASELLYGARSKAVDLGCQNSLRRIQCHTHVIHMSYTCHTHVIHIFSHPTVWSTRRSCHDDLGRPRRKKLHSKRHELVVRRIVGIVIVLNVRQTRPDLLYWYK